MLLKRLEKDLWECLVKPGKKCKPGARIIFGDGRLKAEIKETKEDGNRLIAFEYEGIWEEVLDAFLKNDESVLLECLIDPMDLV